MTGSAKPIGVIADDITGATDIASALAGRGLETRIAFGADGVSTEPADALVVALKIRSVPASQARADAVAAVRRLHEVGARRFFSKYCSTFDSTDEGNIGPIADGLAELIGAHRVVHCPAYPANGRTVYLGHLFVGNELLSDSPMRDHPLNPMRDPQLERLLKPQTSNEVLLVPWSIVATGVDAVAAESAALASGRVSHLIVDAIRDGDLDTIALAIAGDRLAAGSAAFGAAFAVATRSGAGEGSATGGARATVPRGPAAIIAGSMSRATRDQVAAFDGRKAMLSVVDLVDAEPALSQVRAELQDAESADAVLFAIQSDPARGDIATMPQAEVSRRIEISMGRIAQEVVDRGIRRLVVAGGETSGAVASALGLRSARIGPDIAVGVPWVVAEDRDIAIAFKSGNFGNSTFFVDALNGVLE